MTNDADARRMDRRRLVRLAGAGAGIAVAGPLVSAGKAGAATAIPVRVAVLAPTGSSYASMGRSLLDGLALGFDDARKAAVPVSASVVTREVERGYGGAKPAAEALLDDGADVVVAGVSALVAERIGAIFGERKASLVVAGVGAHAVPPASRSPLVVHNSLLYWQASYAAGQWAAAKVGKKAFVAAAQADAGYDAVYAFRRGFESSGGTVVGEQVTHAQAGTTGLAELFAAVRASGASVLHGQYSGARAAQFLQAHAASGAGARLIAGSLAVEDCMLAGLGGAATGVTSCASWTASSLSRANVAFTRAFKARFGRAADPFAALGYDTALLVAEGARRAVQRGIGVRRLAEALSGATVSGPRGTLTVAAATGTVTGPLAIRQVKKTLSGLANVDVAAAPAVGAFPAGMSPLAAGEGSGYLNEFLCA